MQNLNTLGINAIELNLNIFTKKLHLRRPIIIFLFGLIHGLGFAEVLKHVKYNNIEVLMPWSDEEALALSPFYKEFLDIGCVLLVSPANILHTINQR